MSSKLSALTPIQMELLAALRQNSTNTILFHTSIAESYGLNATDHKCLDHIIRNGPLTAGQITEYTGLTTGAVTGIINRLEKAGYVRREKDPEDKRKVLVHKVPSKLQHIDAKFESALGDTIQILCKYSDEELSIILDFINRCNTMVQSHMAK
ncbi:MarR family transcriptional regulator [Paenibacillus sp. URB8-2]|uniref:MarR family transcriptional regulator n=1 Tax=Paenibacillus sp. URB8-2 TaxID=2741301 RepID=UPI0015C0701E|nr:MarR family transcriptional regulator [Paenibacillus sp. URB8-2]